MTHERKTVLVVGATGGSGRATVEALLRAGHTVTAFSRSAQKFAVERDHPRLRGIDGDATDASAVAPAVGGHDAVIVTLGISENPLRVRVLGPGRTPEDVRSRGTQRVIEAMQHAGVRRLVVLSSFGVGATRGRLRLVDRVLFSLLLAPQIADTERQEALVRQSGLDWTLAQPVHLTDAPQHDAPFASASGETRRWAVSRAQVAQYLVDCLDQPSSRGASVTVSG